MSSNLNKAEDQITTTQAAVIVINYMLGAGILTMPRTMAKAVGTPDIWISLLLSSVITFAAGIIIARLCMRFPGKTVFQFTSEIIGKWIAYIICFSIISYFVTISAFEIRVMAEVTRLYLLEATPVWSYVMIFMWVGFYLVIGALIPLLGCMRSSCRLHWSFLSSSSCSVSAYLISTTLDLCSGWESCRLLMVSSPHCCHLLGLKRCLSSWPT